VRTGAIEMANVGWGGFVGTLPALAAAEIPFLYDGVRANAAAQDDILEIYDKLFQDNLNQKALGNFTISAMELISTKPVKTLADWKGLLAQSDTVQGMAVIDILGGSGVVIPFPEIYSAMEKGVVDAAMLAPTFVIIGKIQEVAKYFTPCYALGSTHGALINLDVWNKMPKNLQDALTEEIQKSFGELNQMFIGMYEGDMKALADMGVEVYYLPKAERDKWKEALGPYIEEKTAELGEPALKMKQIADELNAKYPYPY